MSLRFKSLSEVPAHLLPPTEAETPPPRLKYGNEPIEEDGFRFDSKFEAQRYRELKAMGACGLITCLRVHPAFGLHVNGVRIGAIQPDFSYRRDGVAVIEDTKSEATKTPLWMWKSKHFEVEYGLAVTVVMKRKRNS